jgi:hypothetical protein
MVLLPFSAGLVHAEEACGCLLQKSFKQMSLMLLFQARASSTEFKPHCAL